jgi:hypothetical protein
VDAIGAAVGADAEPGCQLAASRCASAIWPRSMRWASSSRAAAASASPEAAARLSQTCACTKSCGTLCPSRYMKPTSFCERGSPACASGASSAMAVG